MMSEHIGEEAVELLVAHLFLHPGAHRAPVAPHIGFLRFLQLLATYDWIGEPLVVDLPGTCACCA
jgi:U3 small nucleolar RNA-associated protein 22